MERIDLEDYSVCSIPIRIEDAGEKFWFEDIGRLGMEGFGIDIRFLEDRSLEDVVVYERKMGDYFKLTDVKGARENSQKENHGKVMLVVPCCFYSKVQVL